MSRFLVPKRTGNRRHRIHTRWFKRPLLVLQFEVEGYVPEYSSGHIDGSIKKWWVDARPEQLMEEHGE